MRITGKTFKLLPRPIQNKRMVCPQRTENTKASSSAIEEEKKNTSKPQNKRIRKGINSVFSQGHKPKSS